MPTVLASKVAFITKAAIQSFLLKALEQCRLISYLLPLLGNFIRDHPSGVQFCQVQHPRLHMDPQRPSQLRPHGVCHPHPRNADQSQPGRSTRWPGDPPLHRHRVEISRLNSHRTGSSVLLGFWRDSSRLCQEQEVKEGILIRAAATKLYW